MTIQLESSRFARHLSVAGMLLLVAVAAVALFPRATDANSSPPNPGADRYWFYLPPSDYSFEVEATSNTMPGGTQTFCVTGGFKRVGEGVPVRIYAKSTGALVLTTSLPLRSDTTTSVLGQGGGRTFKAYAHLYKQEWCCVPCTATWSDPKNVWEIKIWAE